MYRLVDTHAHLEKLEELEQDITNAKAANVIAIIAVGSDYETNQEVLALAQVYKDFVYPALGLHPWNLKDEDIERDLEFIEAHIHEAVGIGEIGLDYDPGVMVHVEKDLQQYALRQVLKLARTYQKPVSIHSRFAWQDSLSLVIEAQLQKAVFHWFTGPSSVLQGIINQGYFVSATPGVEYHKEHRRALKEIPLDRLLLETDSPTVYRRGTKLEYESRPADILRSLAGLSQLRGMDEAEIAEATTANALKIFGL